MSTIEEIVKVEREAETRLKSAQAEADSIISNGKAEAKKIVADARVRRADDENAYLENIESQIKVSADKSQKELETKLKKREEVFRKKTPETVKWIVDEIIRC